MSCSANPSPAALWSIACNATSTARSFRLLDPAILADPERQLALSYAPAAKRHALATLWAIDERFGAIVAAAREPMIGAMRLMWWREALTALDAADAHVPAEPLLVTTADTLLPQGLSGAALADLEDGWSALIEQAEPGETEIVAHAEGRGGRLFALAAALLGTVPEDAGRAGEGWAFADLGHRLRDPQARSFARKRARVCLADVDIARWPPALRPLAVLTMLARQDAAMPDARQRRQGSPKRLLRALAYRAFGR